MFVRLTCLPINLQLHRHKSKPSVFILHYFVVFEVLNSEPKFIHTHHFSSFALFLFYAGFRVLTDHSVRIADVCNCDNHAQILHRFGVHFVVRSRDVYSSVDRNWFGVRRSAFGSNVWRQTWPDDSDWEGYEAQGVLSVFDMLTLSRPWTLITTAELTYFHSPDTFDVDYFAMCCVLFVFVYCAPLIPCELTHNRFLYISNGQRVNKSGKTVSLDWPVGDKLVNLLAGRRTVLVLWDVIGKQW